MPPTLHPRSAATTTLFAGTLVATFVVVGLPHVFPCPRPRRVYADSDRQTGYDDGRPRPSQQHLREGVAKERDIANEAALFGQLEAEAKLREREARECPIPKPKSLIRRVLGWQEQGQMRTRMERKTVNSPRADSRVEP